ncbi:MAG: gamma-glutamyltransferase [Deltaproteobacteria bacterium]|nr:gamma-glutamyltransferase [Deltaproteobacteria bacterium]
MSGIPTVSLPDRFASAVFVLAVLLVPVFSGSSISLAQTRLDGVVVAAHPAAVKAGMGILEQGGNAVDAAVAAAFALAVLDPPSSALGGGGVMVFYRAPEKRVHALDFTEVSPAAATPELYRKGDAREPPDSGALAVAVPGTVAGLVEALNRFGSLPLETVLAPAIGHAVEGVPVTPRFRRAIDADLAALRQRPNFSRIFLKASGVPYEVGAMIRQPELAETLKDIARDGAAAFYEGAAGQAVAARIQRDGGAVNLDDFHSYRPAWRRPLIGGYRGRTVLTVPPPSLGGVALVGLLNVLEGYGADQFHHNSGAYLHLIAETTKAGMNDMLSTLGDPDADELPVRRFTSAERASEVRRKISMEQAAPAVPPGVAPRAQAHAATNHIGVLDGEGNAVSMSLALGSPFGAKVLVREAGIILNNRMRDFSLAGDSGDAAADAANALKPRTRPANGMTPVILLRDERPELIVGGSGGAQTTGAVLQTILNVVDFRMPLAEAVAAPRIHAVPDAQCTLEAEVGVSEKALALLADRGHAVRRGRLQGAVQAIGAEGRGITAASDPRKAGAAR